MPTLLLSSRQTEDAQKLWRACIVENWKVIRLHNWQVPDISPQDVAVYGEPLRDGQPTKSEDGSWSSGDTELEEATRFCETVLQDQTVSLPDAVAVDVGVIQDPGWAVIESNAAFGDGIYGCDPVKVLRVLHRACTTPLK